MRFLPPEYGGWALALFGAIAFFRWRVRWRFAAFAAALPLKRLPRRASIVRRAPFAILASAAALASLAFMEPVIPFSQADVHSRGLDIVIVVDLSSSMQEEMGSGQTHGAVLKTTARTRLVAVKNAVRSFVRSRRDDRIGLVVFSDNPYVISPLTFDHDYLLHYLDLVDDQRLRRQGQTPLRDRAPLP